jgi:hypothetical protein
MSFPCEVAKSRKYVSCLIFLGWRVPPLPLVYLRAAPASGHPMVPAECRLWLQSLATKFRVAAVGFLGKFGWCYLLPIFGWRLLLLRALPLRICFGPPSGNALRKERGRKL